MFLPLPKIKGIPLDIRQVIMQGIMRDSSFKRRSIESLVVLSTFTLRCLKSLVLCKCLQTAFSETVVLLSTFTLRCLKSFVLCEIFHNYAGPIATLLGPLAAFVGVVAKPRGAPREPGLCRMYPGLCRIRRVGRTSEIGSRTAGGSKSFHEGRRGAGL